MNRTAEKRELLEKKPQSELNNMTHEERKDYIDELKQKLKDIPGKLDHASVVAFQIGHHKSKSLKCMVRPPGRKSLDVGVDNPCCTDGPPSNGESSLFISLSSLT